MGSTQSLKELINEFNDVKQSLTINDSMRDSTVWKNCGKHRISTDEAEAKASFLVQRLDAPQCRKFFLKCIYHLSEAEIQSALECATRPYVKCKAKYFNRCCKNLLIKQGL